LNRKKFSKAETEESRGECINDSRYDEKSHNVTVVGNNMRNEEFSGLDVAIVAKFGIESIYVFHWWAEI
jgi:hypothetical protein